jgi:Tol biopolymer transport system component
MATSTDLVRRLRSTWRVTAGAVILIAIGVAAVGIGIAVTGRGGAREERLLFGGNGPFAYYSVASDGTGMRLELTDLGLDEQGGYYVSPDGESLAFTCGVEICLTSLSSSREELRRIPLPGTDLSRNFYYASREIYWSPDSRFATFQTTLEGPDRSYAGSELFLFDAQLRDVRQLLAVDEGTRLWLHAWSPDNRHVAYMQASGFLSLQTLHVISVDDGLDIEVSSDVPGEELQVQNFAWSPDGTSLAFQSGSTLYAVTAEGRDLRVLFEPITPGGYELDWSPDGRWIKAGLDWGGTLIVSATSGESLVVGRPEWEEKPEYGSPWRDVDQLVEPELCVYGYTSQWSPDGGRVAFYGQERDPADRTCRGWAPENAAGLYVLDLDSRQAKRLPGEHLFKPAPLTWSPDGDHLFFTADGEPCREGCPPGYLFAAPADGSEPARQVTEFLVYVLHWSWVGLER